MIAGKSRADLVTGLTDGGFDLAGTPADGNDNTNVGAAWSQANTASHVEYVFNNDDIGSSNIADSRLAFINTTGYVYQLLDQRAVGEDFLSIEFDALEREPSRSGNYEEVTFTIYSAPTGSFTPANGTDIAGAGLTNVGSVTVTAADLGFANTLDGDFEENLDFVTGRIDLRGVNIGDDVFLDLRNTFVGNSEPFVDNISLIVTTVPEPSSFAILGILMGGGFLFVRKRRLGLPAEAELEPNGSLNA